MYDGLIDKMSKGFLLKIMIYYYYIYWILTFLYRDPLTGLTGEHWDG